MTALLSQAVTSFWQTLCEMSPYLLFGFLAAGILSAFVSPDIVSRHLGVGGPWPVVKAALFGVPLPLCSCSVIPVTVSLRKHGAGKGAAVAFLISTPQTGVDSIFVTFSLLGPVFAVFRPVVAFVTGIVGGWLVKQAEDNGAAGTAAPVCHDECCTGFARGRFYHVFHYGFITLARDIAKPLLAGLVVAGVISAVVPDDYFAGALGGGIVQMLVMLVIGVPMYVCSTASVPVAAALIAKGLSPGAALVFLIAGAATNAAGIMTTLQVMGKRVTAIYLVVVGASALVSGLVLDFIFKSVRGQGWETIHSAWMLPGYIKVCSAIVLLAVLGFALLSPLLKKERESCCHS